MSLNEHLCEDCSVVSKSHRLTLKISKATGPGSRGGKVLGITRSGKPIYQHGGGTENYHAIDHTDAAESHGAHGMLARVKGDVGAMNHHRAMAKEHLDAAAGPKPSPSARPIHQRIKEHFSNMGGMGGGAMAHAKSLTGDDMTSIQILKSYLAKSKVRSGNVDADTVDEVDGDLTGASAMGKDENAPGGWDDQPAADKKVKKKFKGHDQSDSKNAGRSVEAQTEVGSVSVNHTTLSSAGPYDCDGGDVTKISEPSPTKTVDGNVYRSMTDADEGDGEELVKAGEGSRGGHVIGHTKSGKAVYTKKTGHKSYNAQDHHDAAEIHLKTAGDHLSQFRSEKSSPKQKDEAAAKIDHHLALSDHFRQTSMSAKKSSNSSDFYKGGNGKSYQRQVHDFGAVQHVAGGMDQYCAELAKGGTFWANGADWHNSSDPGVAQMVMCKSCDHSHSVMYTACPECEAGGDFSKSLAQPKLHFAAPMRPIEPESDIVRFD